MDITLGIKHGRDLQFATDEAATDVETRLGEAMKDGSVFAITDSKGRRIVVPGDKITFAEIGVPKPGAVGFRS